MAWSLSSSPEGGTQFSLGIGGEEPPPTVAGEPPGLPTRTIMIVGGLALAAVMLYMLVK